METITWSDFERIEMRIGTIIRAEDFPEARKPAYKLLIDFGGEIGLRKSSAQITTLYAKESLPGRQVIAVVNFSPKQIGNFMSECLVLGAVGAGGEVTLLTTKEQVQNGLRVV
jgi:tRNA-binding protein